MTEAGPPEASGRIALMLPRFSLYGGVEQFGFHLARCLARRGHEVDFLCARQETEAPPGVRVIALGRPPGSRALKLFWFLLRAELARRGGAYDLSVSLGKNLSQDIIRMGGGPLKVFWAKSLRALPPGAPRLAKMLRRRLSPVNHLIALTEKRQFTGKGEVAAVSHLVRDWLLAAYPALKPEKVRVIYNRPDLERFYPPGPGERASARQALLALCSASASERLAQNAPGRLAEALFIGTASTNFQLKGVGPLVRAMSGLPERVHLFVAGGRDASLYKDIAISLGLEKRVHFCGRVDDMPAFYKALNIFVLPTYYDACSNAVLEALASGCAVISSKDNGAAFFLDKEALLDDPGDVDALAARLRLFMDRPPPPPFVWPENMPAGVEAFADYVEEKLAEKMLSAGAGRKSAGP
ncbi:glycosyltransferase family 4 protein [Desulfovibrio sp. OttesenSCG-928-G11]|nr:glycosyltransferase family 4 protein [Desulfovibrio sp. OttesenSCG-928-G11]